MIILPILRINKSGYLRFRQQVPLPKLSISVIHMFFKQEYDFGHISENKSVNNLLN